MQVVIGVLAGIVVTELAVVATTVYLHRGLAHRALTVHPFVAWCFRLTLWLTTGMRPREWAAVHRCHHASTDTPADPHSPGRLGFWRVQLTNAALYRRAARDGVTVRKYARDLPPDAWDRVLFDHAVLGLGLGIAILCVTLGWEAGLIAAVTHALLYLGLSGAVNAVGHTYGRRPHPNSATNVQSLALLTAGEGLHNNHHAAPTSARFAHRRGQLDPGWWCVRALVAARLASVRHDRATLRSVA